jgi:hypothetical protein
VATCSRIECALSSHWEKFVQCSCGVVGVDFLVLNGNEQFIQLF